jgi:transcriptional regulator with XRE-family HTH domain
MADEAREIDTSTDRDWLRPSDWFRDVRTRAGLTQQEFAAANVVAQSVVTVWERPSDATPRPETLARVAAVLGVEPPIMLCRAGGVMIRRAQREPEIDREKLAASNPKVAKRFRRGPLAERRNAPREDHAPEEEGDAVA